MIASDFDFYYGTAFVDGRITIPPGVPGYWCYFSPKSVTLDPNMAYEITLTFANHQDAEAPWVTAYTLRPDGDAEASRWEYLYDGDNHVDGATSLTFTISPRLQDYTLGVVTWGETRLMLEVDDADVTGFTITPVDVWTGATFGAPVQLDDTWEPYWSSDTFHGYENVYSTGVRVSDDVVLAAWMHQGADGPIGTTGGSEFTYEARAVRWVEGQSGGVSSLVAGPPHHGPLANSLPGWNPAWDDDVAPPNSAPGNYRIAWVVRLGNNRAFIQCDQNDYPQNILGYIVEVNPATLEITFIESVHSDSTDWMPDGWSWAPAYGDGRVLTQISGPEFTRLLISFGATGEIARRTVDSYGPTGSTGFQWNEVMTIVDRGDHFISLTLSDTPGTSNEEIRVYRHAVDNNLPAENPTLVLAQPRYQDGAYAWDFDGTYAVAMGNGKIYIAENDWTTGKLARLRVLDIEAATMHVALYLSSPLTGFGAHLWDWMSLEAIDDNSALLAVGDYWKNSNPGVKVRVFDGAAITFEENVYPYSAGASRWRNRDLWSNNSSEAYYLGEGRVVTLVNGELDDSPAPYTVDDPGISGNTWAVPSRIFPHYFDFEMSGAMRRSSARFGPRSSS